MHSHTLYFSGLFIRFYPKQMQQDDQSHCQKPETLSQQLRQEIYTFTPLNSTSYHATSTYMPKMRQVN